MMEILALASDKRIENPIRFAVYNAWEFQEMYGSHELPIVISSLQKNLNKAELDQELKKAQVNTFCDFPASSSQIKSWIN